MNVMVVGLGSIGLRHARNFREIGANVIVGVDPSADRRDGFAREFGGNPVADLEEGLARRPDLSVITSPNCFHIPQATRCAEAGSHLFVEKPLGTSLDGVDALIATIEARGLFAHVGSNFKFHPSMRIMRDLLDAGSLGKVTAAQVLAGQWLPGWHPNEDYRMSYSARADLGGGIVLDTHEFDYLTWLLGPVDKLEGFSTRSGSLDLETEDVACACLHFSNGALATILVDYIQREYRRRYHISGDGGTVEWDFLKGEVTIYLAATGKTESINVSEDTNEMYLRQARHVLHGVVSGEPPITSVATAAKVLRLQLKIRSSRV